MTRLTPGLSAGDLLGPRRQPTVAVPPLRLRNQSPAAPQPSRRKARLEGLLSCPTPPSPSSDRRTHDERARCVYAPTRTQVSAAKTTAVSHLASSAHLPGRGGVWLSVRIGPVIEFDASHGRRSSTHDDERQRRRVLILPRSGHPASVHPVGVAGQCGSGLDRCRIHELAVVGRRAIRRRAERSRTSRQSRG